MLKGELRCLGWVQEDLWQTVVTVGAMVKGPVEEALKMFVAPEMRVQGLHPLGLELHQGWLLTALEERKSIHYPQPMKLLRLQKPQEILDLNRMSLQVVAKPMRPMIALGSSLMDG